MFLPPKKSLGQHFLNSKHVLSQIIEAAKLQKGELVLEIGPGTGILTEALLNMGVKVITIEKDDRAIDLLAVKFQEFVANGQLTIIRGDILDESTYTIPKTPYLVVANIPYYITGAILEKFLENGYKPSRMVLLVQKEVAERIIARDNKESILSVSVKAFGTPKIVAKVPPGAFTPPPTVDSAILAIENISNKLFDENKVETSNFFKVVKAGFAHKRKFAIRNLEDSVERGKIERTWATLGIDAKIRPEDLTTEVWLKICRAIDQQN